MFGLGPAEVIVVLVIALIVFGPGRLPEMGQALGKSIREFREASNAITGELTREVEETKRVVSDSKAAAKPEEPAQDATGDSAS
jgi:TatA/E family protein of Tat protein translocase